MVEAESSSLFVVFFLSLYSIVLVPYTIFKLCNVSSETKQVVKPWAKAAKKESRMSKAARQLVRPSNLALLGLWAFFVFLVFYVQVTAQDASPFDPYKILELETGATDKDVKRAYRHMSLRFHPDKNPDPEASKYFAEYITKAYKALSDPVARRNYEQHGHPDGPQSVSMGIALPKWLLEGDSKTAPLLLASLVGLFILLPLIAAACYLLRSDKYVGQDGIMAETYDIFFRSPLGIREGQSLGRILETITVAMEFINMPTLQEQLPALEELRKDTLRAHPDLRDKKAFWQRKPSCVKASMLLLAHLERVPVPAMLQKDLLYVLGRAAPLAAEMVKLAAVPRAPTGCGWLAPAVGSVEFLQHLVQAVPIAARKNPGAHKGVVEGPAPLLQLPHLDADVARKLQRKRVRGLSELQALPGPARREALDAAGLSEEQVDDVETALSSIPTVSVSAVCEVAGEPEAAICVEDVVTCKARILLTRPSHATQELDRDGSAVAAFAPHFPLPREEKWFLFVADPLTNEVLSNAEPVSLLEAEYLGAQAAATEAAASSPAANGSAAAEERSKAAAPGADTKQADGKSAAEPAAEPAGQLVEVKFLARTAARKDYTLFVMCDSWIGADKLVPLKLKVNEKTRAAREGRVGRGGRVIPLDENGVPEEEDEYYEEDEEEEGEEGEDEEEYDSEDSGTEESGSDDDEQEAAAAAKSKPVAVAEVESESDQSTDENEEGVVPKAATLQGQ